MKRALTTFGNPFGLALYDKHQAGVRGRIGQQQRGAAAGSRSWNLLSKTGEILSEYRDALGFCGALRKQIEAAEALDGLEKLWARNSEAVARLENAQPALTSDQRQPYGEILKSLFERRRKSLSNGAVVSDAPDRRSEKAASEAPALEKPRRVRDKEHLRYLRSQPCLICERGPSQAHHLSFVQPKALGRKASDEWTVPLCRTHHRSLHDDGNEKRWWDSHRIDAVIEATRLWARRWHAETNDPVAVAKS